MTWPPDFSTINDRLNEADDERARATAARWQPIGWQQHQIDASEGYIQMLVLTVYPSCTSCGMPGPLGEFHGIADTMCPGCINELPEDDYRAYMRERGHQGYG